MQDQPNIRIVRDALHAFIVDANSSEIGRRNAVMLLQSLDRYFDDAPFADLITDQFAADLVLRGIKLLTIDPSNEQHVRRLLLFLIQFPE